MFNLPVIAASAQASVSPLRVTFVITGLATGGAELMLEKLLLALAPGVQAQVVSLGGLGEVGSRLRTAGFDVRPLCMRSGMPSPLAWLRLVRWLRAFRPHVVHTWMYHADLLGGLAARAAGVRAVMWCLRQSNIDPALNRRSTLWVMRACAALSHRVPQRIVCAGQRARDAHVAAGYAHERMLLIPNGFDFTRFKPDAAARAAVRRELRLPEGAMLVGMIGRFDSQKNHHGFVRVMASLAIRLPALHALLAGPGVDAGNAELSRWLAAAGMQSRCHLLGRRDDMPRLIAALDLLLLPSLGEAFPNVVGEAMACGVPCVVSDVGDAAAIVDGLCPVVPAGHDDAMADAAERLLHLTPVERHVLALQLQDSVRRRYDIRNVAARYEAEYRALARAS